MSWRKRSRQSCFFLDTLWSISFPHSEALTHLGWVVVTVPRKFLYIHIVRRGVNANVPARAHTISPFRYDYGRGYTRKRIASRHGLFMGYIARFLPPTRVLMPLLPCRSFPFFLLFLFFFSYCVYFLLLYAFSVHSSLEHSAVFSPTQSDPRKKRSKMT